MAPIRIAIIGLSASAKTSWASSAHLPYLLSPRGQSKYTIVALCNSTVEAARRSIETYNLPLTTRAYGDAAALASDPDIDLVVCCTRVDTHYDLIKPSVEAGKNVFVEWPLTQDVERSRDLTRLVEAKGVKSVVGLQGRLAPAVEKLRELVTGGEWGRVLSVDVRGFGGTVDRETLSEGLAYFADRKIGGNMLIIGFGHMFDYVQAVVGKAINTKTHFQTQRPEIKLRDPATNTITRTTTSNVPDLVNVIGTLTPSPSVQDGASISVRFRRGQPFKHEPAFTWHINCERGEIRLIAPSGPSLHAGGYSEPVTIEVHDHEKDEVNSVEWAWPQWQTEENAELPIVGRSVAKVYEAYAAGEGYPTFSDALEFHEQLGGFLASLD